MVAAEVDGYRLSVLFYLFVFFFSLFYQSSALVLMVSHVPLFVRV